MMDMLINIDVDDLDRAVAFYTAAFGLRIGRRFGAAGTELLGGPAPIHLLAKAPGTAPTPSGGHTRDYARHWTPIHLDLVVTNIEECVQRAVAAGARLENPVDANAWRKMAVMADPFGHGFCVIELLGRGYDAVAR